MKNILFFFYFLTSSFLFAQNGIIEYKKSILSNKNTKQNKALINSTNKKLADLTYNLEFNSKASLFYLDDELVIDELDRNIKTAIRIGNGKGVYFTNTNGDIIHNIDYFGVQYNVNYNKVMGSLNWELSSERKQILGYLCYLATTTREIENPKGKFYQKIKVWYCPELNPSYGPIGYSNYLPGMILEIQVDNVQYTAVTINYTPKLIREIPLPKASKSVTYKEYLDISKKLYLKMIKGRN